METLNLLRELDQAQTSIEVVGAGPLGFHRRSLWEELLRQLNRKPDLAITMLCECDNDLFARSLSTDTVYAEERISFAQLRDNRRLLQEMFEEWQECQRIDGAQAQELRKPRLDLRYVYSPVTLYAVRIDSTRLYVALVTHRIPTPEEYSLLSDDSPLYTAVQEYVEYLLDPDRGGRFMASPSTEVLQLYDQDKAPRGIYPRSAFYDTDFHQFVIWDFIFDRSGNLLVHKRAENAKDNRDLWDKSVGGHVDWVRELSSHETAVREMIEELFEDELNKESMAMFTETEKNVIYLGEWRRDKRGRKPLEELRNFRTEWGYFRLPMQLKINTPRLMPDGTERRLRVIVDMYAFVANPALTKEKLDSLKNSRFELISLPDLKTAVETGRFISARSIEEDFMASPDLRYIMSGKIRDLLEEFSNSIQYVWM